MIVGTVPSTLPNAILAPSVKPGDVSVSTAIEQHDTYVKTISSTPSVTGIIRLPQDDALPDSVFVEDPVVVLSEHTAFVPLAGHPNRDGESDALVPILEQLGVEVLRTDVKLDGGDVMRVGEFYIVGISNRTEEASLAALQAAVDRDFETHSCWEFRPQVVSVHVSQGLHLKSAVTWVGDVGVRKPTGFLVAPDSDIGHKLIGDICRVTGRNWDVAWVREDDSPAANVLFIPPAQNKVDVRGGRVFVQSTFPNAVHVLQSKVAQVFPGRAIEVLAVDMSELIKANGALTCSSVLIKNDKMRSY